MCYLHRPGPPAHLTNQKVVDENLVLEMLTLLLDKPTDDSVEVAVGLVKDVGAALPPGMRHYFWFLTIHPPKLLSTSLTIVNHPLMHNIQYLDA